MKEQSAAADIYDVLVAGTFYQRQEQALKDLGMHGQAAKVKPLADEERARSSNEQKS